MVFQVSAPQEHFNNCVTRIKQNRMLSDKVNFHYLSQSTRRTVETLRPKKRWKMSNAAALFNEFSVEKILFSVINDSL